MPSLIGRWSHVNRYSEDRAFTTDQLTTQSCANHMNVTRATSRRAQPFQFTEHGTIYTQKVYRKPLRLLMKHETTKWTNWPTVTLPIESRRRKDTGFLVKCLTYLGAGGALGPPPWRWKIVLCLIFNVILKQIHLKCTPRPFRFLMPLDGCEWWIIQFVCTSTPQAGVV